MKINLQRYSNSLFLYIFIVVFSLSSAYKIMAVQNQNSIITMDQGRDLVDLRGIYQGKSLRLVGPTTSINGVLLGPSWYYFILFPYVLFGGNPEAVLYWQIIWFQISSIIIYFVLRNKNKEIAYLTSMFILLLPIGFYSGRYFWNANAMPFFTTLYFASFLWSILNNSNKKMFLLGIISGIGLQIEAAFGIILFPFALLYFIFNKTNIKKILNLISGFAITLMPQILFEIRHGFLMTHTLLNQFSGKADILGEKLTWGDKLFQRYTYYLGIIRDTSHIPANILFIIYSLLLVNFLFLLYKRQIKKVEVKLFVMYLAFIIFSFIFYLIFPYEIKRWYGLGLSIPFILLFSLLISKLINYRKIIILLPISIIVFAIYHTVIAQNQYLKEYTYSPSTNPSLLRNQLSTIDLVYEKAEGQGFNVYNYVPSIYDYSYQYLFWWYGLKKYSYLPNDIAYLPNQPEYIANQKSYFQDTKENKNGLTFLIIETNELNNDFFQPWLGNFSKLCKQNTYSFNWSINIVEYIECN